MGFFSWIGDIVSTVVEKVVDFFSGSVGSESSYRKEESDVYTTERLNDILLSFTTEYFSKATEIEKDIIKEVEKYCTQLITEAQNINLESEEFTLKRLKKAQRNIKTSISGSIRNPLERRMSLSDGECLKILKMNSGQQKKEAMKKFTHKVISEALNNLSCTVKQTLDEQMGEIEEHLGKILRSREKEFLLIKKQYEDLVNNKAKEEEKEKFYIEPLLTIFSSETIEQMLF